MQTSIALADDHSLVRNGIAGILEKNEYRIVYQCDSAQMLLDQLPQCKPDVVLMDVNMPGMDGYVATRHISENYPEVRVVALSMHTDDLSVIRMIRAGARGFVPKDAEPQDLLQCLENVMNKGYYYSDFVSGKLVHAIASEVNPEAGIPSFTDRESEFIKLACSELTYKEIADLMHVSPRSVDGYRDSVFHKLNLKSRVGLTLFAVRYGMVDP